MSSEEVESSSSGDEFGEDQEVSQVERETYQKIRKEMYNIRKHRQKRAFDLDDEEPRLIDILKQAKKDKVLSYDPDSWDDTKFVIATIFFSGLIAWGQRCTADEPALNTTDETDHRRVKENQVQEKL